MYGMKFFISIMTMVLMVNGQPNDSQLYPWIISMKVADIEGNDYFGGMQMDLVFKDFSLFNLTLPLQQYKRGAVYDFNVQLHSSNQLQYAIIRTIGFCQKSKPLDVLRLDWVQFISDITKSKYIKRLNHIAVKDKCQQQRGTVLIDFEETAADKCEIGGRSYNDGEAFNVDCALRCHCDKGQIACVDLCPPFNWLHSSNYTCQEVRIAGQCCPTLSCVNKLGQTITFMNGTTNGNDTQCSHKLEEPMKREFEFGFPSTVLVCDGQCDDASKLRTAVKLNDKWVMMRGNTKFDMSNLSVFAMNGLHSNFLQFKVKQIVKDETRNLYLLQVADYFPYTLVVQDANLPITKEHCNNLIVESCLTISPSIQFTSRQHPLNSTKKTEMHMFPVTKLSDCSIVDNNGSSICLAKPKEDCIAANGDPLFISNSAVTFLVGLLQQTSQDLFQLNNCQKEDFSVGVNICSSLDWIRKTINSI